MKHYTTETIDHKRYVPMIKIEVVGGSRPRLTLTHNKTKKTFLFKTYSHNPREVWAECLASHLGQVLGIAVQHAVIKYASRGIADALTKHFSQNLPENWRPIGTLAGNIFRKDEEIVYGEKIVGTKSDSLTLDQISEAISKQYYAPEDLLQAFAEMIIFDALIGNMDRHHQNWGVVETIKYKQQLLFDKKQLVGQRHFVPLYDHGSSLLFELSEADVETYLNNQDKFYQKYILGNRYSFLRDASGRDCNVFEVVQRNINSDTPWGKRFKKSIRQICAVSKLELGKAIIKMPNVAELDYSKNRKELLFRSLLLRHQTLMGMLQ